VQVSSLCKLLAGSQETGSILLLGGCLLVQKWVVKGLLSCRRVRALPQSQHNCTGEQGARQQQFSQQQGGVTDSHYLMTNSDFTLRKAVPMPETAGLNHSLVLAQVLTEGRDAGFYLQYHGSRCRFWVICADMAAQYTVPDPTTPAKMYMTYQGLASYLSSGGE